MNRIEKLKLAKELGYTCNPETGEVFGLKGQLEVKKKVHQIPTRN